ncbi:MAG: PP2C family serine/threonine-protein phosphatase [Myxococcota bacterium]|nr:PP2C family serine/threonine-protein phosphatase [Myxococcota bacterium]
MSEPELTEETADQPTELGAATHAPWQVAGASVTGAKHVVADKPCQDALLTFADESCAVVAVADGHGDPRHARSDVGSKLACEVAVGFMRELAADINSQSRHFKEWERELRLRVPRHISFRWNRAVREHAGHEQPDGVWHQDVDLYGTTLLVVLLTRRCVVVYQLGDGDLVLVGPQGVRCAFPPSDELFGTLTWSLAMANAPEKADLVCMDPRQLRLVMACTDGIRDAFAKNPEAFIEVGRWMQQRLTDESLEEVQASLPEWLSELSRRGNGDDATLGLLRL